MRSIRNQALSMWDDGQHPMCHPYCPAKAAASVGELQHSCAVGQPCPTAMQCCKALIFYCTYGKTAAGFAWAVPGEKHELWSWVPIGLYVCFAHQQHLLFSNDASWSLLSLEKVLSCLNGVTVIFILFFSLPFSSCFSNGFLL